MMDNTTLLKLQCAQLGLLVALSQGTKRWGERTVIMRKGKLVSVGGEIMPKDPPAYRVLTPEQWMRFIQGDIKNFGDINVKRSDTSTYVASAAALSSILSAGITSIDQDGQINNIVQAVYQDENKDAIIENIKATSPVKNNQFIEGISQFISNTKNGFDNAVESIKETIANTKFLTKSGEFLIQGLITGGLITAGIAAMGVFDLAIFGSAIPVIRNLAIVKKLTDPTLIWMTEKLGMSKLMATISSKILFGLTKLPIGLFIGECWQYLKDLEIDAKNLKDVDKCLPKQVSEESKLYLGSSEERTDKIIETTKDTIKELSIDAQQVKDRLIAERERPLSSAVNSKYTLERRLLEADHLRQEIQREKDWLANNPKKQDEFMAESLNSYIGKKSEIGKFNEDIDSHVLILEDLENSYKWHKGIIETELKYGETLDKIQEDEIEFKRLENGDFVSIVSGFKELIAKLKTGKRGTIISVNPDYSSYTYNEENSTWKAVNGKKLDLEIVKTIDATTEGVKELLEMSNTHPSIQVAYITPRAFHHKIDDTSSLINTGTETDRKSTAFHETGHAIESMLGISNVSQNYINSRSDSLYTSDMQDLYYWYGRGEITRITDFTDSYIAKKYNGASELVSMSVQNLADQYNLRDALKKDREHILYGLWALDYKPGN